MIDTIKTILAADDSSVALALLSRHLQSAGYRVVTAVDGIEAAQQAYRQMPDLIILDITMPRMNGYQVCRLLKRDAAVAHIPVIILTGAESRGTEFWSLRTGADAFLFKSSDSTDLLSTVEKLLSISSESQIGSTHTDRAANPPGPEEILTKMCALMDEELYASTVERIQLKTIQKYLQDGVLTIDLRRDIIAANQALCNILGKEEREILTFPAAGMIGEPAGTSMLEAFETALSGEAAVDIDSEIFHSSGSTTPVSISVVPLRDYLGETVGGVCIFNDITRRKEIEALFDQLQSLDRVKNDLTHMIVHDLRTPLTSLLAGLQTLEPCNALDAMEREILEISISGGNTLLGMINDLLDVSKMEDGSMTLDRSSTILEDLVSESLQQVGSLAQEKRLTMSAQIAPDMAPLCVDADKLRRVLVNLLGNAVKFTPDAGAITVIAQTSADGREIVLRVQDTGEGIPTEAFGRIFEKFGQVETRKAGKTMSTGLGLTFCKLVVEAHSGRIWVESQPGQGSTFSFTLPAAP